MKNSNTLFCAAAVLCLVKMTGLDPSNQVMGRILRYVPMNGMHMTLLQGDDGKRLDEDAERCTPGKLHSIPILDLKDVSAKDPMDSADDSAL